MSDSLDAVVRHVPSPLFGEPLSPWHWWFAWRPVQTWDHRWVWLRRIQRRFIQKHEYLSHGGNDWWWQYHWEHGYLPNAPHQARAVASNVQQLVGNSGD